MGVARAIATGAVLLVAACADGDDPPPDDAAATTAELTDTTAASTTTTAAGEAPTTTSSDVAPAPPGDFPGEAVVATVDGRFGVIDTATGDIVREARSDVLSDLDTPRPEGGHAFAADIARVPDGTAAYVDICCEPAGGRIDRVDLGTGVFEPVITGWNPSVSPDGTAVVHGSYTNGIGVLRGEEHVLFDGPRDDVFRQYEATAWLDDDTVAYVVSKYEGDATSVLYVHDLAEPDLLDDAVLAEPGEKIVALVRRRDGKLVWLDDDGVAHVVDPATGEETTTFDLGEPVTDLAYDASGTWLLVVDADRDLRWFGGGESGTIPGRYVAAAW